MPTRIERGRLELRVPVTLLARLDAYQEKEQVASRTQAVIELLRRALAQAGC